MTAPPVALLAWAVDLERRPETLQTFVDNATQARFYYSDLFVTYRSLMYHLGLHTPRPDKSKTFRIEGVNAELRHYLTRLVRQSRCFSRCLAALHRDIKLFVFA